MTRQKGLQVLQNQHHIIDKLQQPFELSKHKVTFPLRTKKP